MPDAVVSADVARQLTLQIEAQSRRRIELDRQMAMMRHLIDTRAIRPPRANNLRGVIADESYAPQFHARHTRLLQAKQFGRALANYGAAHTHDEQKAALTPAYRRALELGGFFDQYSLDLVREWMRSPNRVFAYASGNPIDLDSMAEGANVVGGDIHLEIPDDASDAPLAMTMPHLENGDDLFDPKNEEVKGILKDIERNHASAGTVRDIAADDAYAHAGFASAARAAAFEHVKRLPRKYPIKYMIAELFAVTGIKLQDGSEIRIQEPFSPVTNIASMVAHVRSERYPAVLGWRLRGKESPVYLDGDDETKEPSKLLVDWHAVVHKL